jgi:hypothetical protein
MTPTQLLSTFAVCASLLVSRSQDPAGGAISEGFGRAASYRQALAMALEDAVGKARGIAVARGPGLRSRLEVVAAGASAAEAEPDAWVALQLDGFVSSYEVARKAKADDGQWEVTVRAAVATATAPGPFAIDLEDNDLRRWQLARFEEGGAGAPFAKVEGAYEAPSIRDHLRATGRVRIVAADGVVAPAGAAPRERGKAGHRLIASHRVRVQWEPMQFTSLVEKPNPARPTTGPRPQYLTAASVRAAIAITDLVQGVAVFERALTVALDVPAGTPVERLEAMAVQLADQAKAEVAETIFFALEPPTVVRKWPGEGGEDWFVEAAIARRIAGAYDAFVVGNAGSLASPDWRPLGRAVLIGGNGATCTFRLLESVDPSRIEAGVTEIRPARK